MRFGMVRWGHMRCKWNAGVLLSMQRRLNQFAQPNRLSMHQEMWDYFCRQLSMRCLHYYELEFRKILKSLLLLLLLLGSLGVDCNEVLIGNATPPPPPSNGTLRPPPNGWCLPWLLISYYSYFLYIEILHVYKYI